MWVSVPLLVLISTQGMYVSRICLRHYVCTLARMHLVVMCEERLRLLLLL